MIKKELLIINQVPFGYHIDYLNYCRYLKKDFNITYLCWSYSQYPVKIEEAGINVQYISRSGSIVNRNIRFIRAALNLIAHGYYGFIFIKYFFGCSVIPIIYNRKHRIHLDIRSGSISCKFLNRTAQNYLMVFESWFFKSISIISTGLRKLLKVSHNAYILPLGANPLIVNRQNTHKLSLLYIGTFLNRRIDDTVTGLGMFVKENPGADVHYTIIGSGWSNEIERIKDKIKENNLHEYVDLEGYILHDELVRFYEVTNVGISYIPMTSYYEYQPATKTFEYLMAGMPVIATGTFENRKIVNDNNGIIINDNPESFAAGLKKLYCKIDSYNENFIRESVSEYKWETITENLKEFIKNGSC